MALHAACGNTTSPANAMVIDPRCEHCSNSRVFKCSRKSPVQEIVIADVVVKALKNGLYEVVGGAKIIEDVGKKYSESAIYPTYLCRCGHSKTTPFCDKSYKKIGFKVDKTAK